MSDTADHLAPWTMLKAPPGTCPGCAVTHEAEQPHNKQSLCYQYTFYRSNGRWPTWADAVAHCAPAVREAWERELRKREAWDGP